MPDADLERKIRTAPDLKLAPNPLLTPPPGMEVRTYQVRAALLMVLRGRMVLGDDVGLGKTVSTITALTYLLKSRPGSKVLVFTEKAALRQWEREFHDWSRIDAQVLSAESMKVAQRRRALEEFRPDAFVTNYALLYRHPDEMVEAVLRHQGIVVFDELPFRRWGAQISKLTRQLSLAARSCFGLTATIVEGKLAEAFSVVQIVAPDTFLSKAWFERAYVVSEPVYEDQPFPRRIVGYKNLDDLRDRLRPVFYGRKATNPEVKQALPEVLEKEVPIEMGPDQTRYYLQAEQGYLELPWGAADLDHLAALIRCQQLANAPASLGWEKVRSAKLDALAELLAGSLEGAQVLVFSDQKETIKHAAARLAREKVEHGILTGDVSGSGRQSVQERFQEGKLQVLLLTQAGGRALNLQAGSHLIELNPPWTYGVDHQLVGRLRRTGSRHASILVWRFLAELNRGVAKAKGLGRRRATIDHHRLRHVRKGKRLYQAVTEGTEDAIEEAEAAQAAVGRAMRGNEIELD